ncbi:MAG: hypothetical protein SOZ79_01810 [Candidatus Ventricola sp.]|nr:hypothetical protein [Candidatus Ventricola sp.]
MRRILAAMMAALLLPACAQAAQIVMAVQEDEAGGSRLAVFSAAADTIDTVPGQETPLDAVMMAIDAQIEARFAQQKAQVAVNRGTVMQTGSVWQDGKTASMALTWQGEQADGSDGCASMGLTVNLKTGEEILLSQLFSDWDGAQAAMETIITDDVLDGMSDYMEYAELLPMPTDNYAFDDFGLTVYWPEDRYRYFDGTSGSVTFYWHELADFIGEESPVYALAHPDVPYSTSEIEALCMSGSVTRMQTPELGEKLGDVAVWYRMADPDYTTDALVYPLERMRGFAVEIPKYAETEEDETPISAIRASRVSMAGLLTTGKTTDTEVLALLGEPAREQAYDEDAAFDAMLPPGRSLLYEISGRVLQMHFDEDGVLACVILRSAMPEGLY